MRQQLQDDLLLKVDGDRTKFREVVELARRMAKRDQGTSHPHQPTYNTDDYDEYNDNPTWWYDYDGRDWENYDDETYWEDDGWYDEGWDEGDYNDDQQQHDDTGHDGSDYWGKGKKRGSSQGSKPSSSPSSTGCDLCGSKWHDRHNCPASNNAKQEELLVKPQNEQGKGSGKGKGYARRRKGKGLRK